MKPILFIIGLMAATQTVYAAEGEVRASVKPERQWGTYIGLGNPYPSLLGLNGAYNINDHIRASVGYGEVEVTTSIEFTGSEVSTQKIKAQTYSAGADYLFLDTAIRPVVGARAGYFNISGKGDFSIQGISKSTALIYSNVGADWVAGNGFNVGTGLNIAMLGGKGVNYYANVGYFF